MISTLIGRRALVLPIVLVAMLTFGCGKSDPQAGAKKKLDALREQMTAEMQKEVDAGGIDPVKQAERERLFKVEMQKVLGATGADENDPMRVAMKLIQDLQLELAEYNKRTDEVGALLDTPNLKTTQGLDKIDAEMAWLIKESKRLEGVVSALPATLERTVRQTPGTTDRDVEAAKQGAKIDRIVPVLLTIRRCDTRTWEAWQTRAKLFRAEMGKWTIDPATQVINFERAAANDEFNATADAIDAATKEQLEAQKQMLAIQKE